MNNFGLVSVKRLIRIHVNKTTVQHSVRRIEKSLKTNDICLTKRRQLIKRPFRMMKISLSLLNYRDRKYVRRNGHRGFHSTMRFGVVSWVGTGKVTWCYRATTVLWRLDGQQIHHRIYLNIFDTISSAINHNKF